MKNPGIVDALTTAEVNMIELSKKYRQVIEALVAGPVVWMSPEEVSAATHTDVDETTDVLCELDLAGWVEIWEEGTTPRVTLSPLGALHSGMRVVELGPDRTPWWVPRASSPNPAVHPAELVVRKPPAARAAATATAPKPHREVAPAASPEPVAHRNPQHNVPDGMMMTAVGCLRTHEIRRPAVLVGVGLAPWPGPAHQEGEESICPACGNRALESNMYCVYCDRWGLDPGPEGVVMDAPHRSSSTPAKSNRGPEPSWHDGRSRRSRPRTESHIGRPPYRGPMS